MYRLSIFVVLLLFILPIHAQDDALSRIDEWREVAELGRGIVSKVKYSPDGSLLAVTGVSGIWLYDTETFELVRHFARRPAEVIDFDWSSDSKRIVTANKDITFTIWDVERDHEIDTFPAYRSETQGIPLTGIAWSTDETEVAIGNQSGWFMSFDVETGEAMDYIPGQQYPMSMIDWSSSYNYLTILRTQVSVYNMDTNQRVDTLPKRGPQYAMAWSPDGNLLAYGTGGQIIIWNAKTAQTLRMIEGYEDGSIINIIWSPDGQYLATYQFKGDLIIWEVATGQSIKTISIELPFEFSNAWSPDGKFLTFIQYDRAIADLDIESGEWIPRIDEHMNAITELAISPDGKQVFASAFLQPYIYRWSLDTMEFTREPTEHEEPITNLAVSSDGLFLTSSSRDKTNLWYANGLDPLTTFEGISTAIWAPESRFFYTGKQILDVDETLIYNLDEPLSLIAWSPDETQFASIVEGEIRVGDYRNWDESHFIGFHNANQIQWSSDGTQIMTVGNDEFYMWDVDDGLILHSEMGIKQGLYLNEILYAVALANGKIEIREIETHDVVKTFQHGQDVTITKLVISHNKDFIASGGTDGMIHVFGLPE